jgi:PAS domain S-box-containing protein
MSKAILNIMDFEKVDALLEGFNKSTGFVTAIIDIEGNILSKSGWRQMCTRFHRIHPETSKKCITSDTKLANRFFEGEKYHFYKCLNGLVDVAVPIVINGEHIANLFSGQFLFEKPEITFFKKQAKRYGFDEKEYLDALSKVPIVPEEKVKTVMDFLLKMTQMISEITFQKIEQAKLNETIRESEEKFRAIYENINDAVFINEILPNGEFGNFLYFNTAAIKSLGYTSDELKSMSPGKLNDPDKSKQYIPIAIKQLKEKRMSKFEASQVAKDGRKIDMEINAVVTNIGGEDVIVSVCRDITEKKVFQRILTEKEQFLSAIYEGISHSIFVVDVLENGNFQYAGLNPQHEKITGISTGFIKDKKPEDVLPEEAALNVRNRYTECVNLKQTIAYEEWLPFGGKHTCWETILNPRINEAGNVYQIIGTSQEITKRRLAEDKRRESEEKLTSIFNNMIDVVWSISWPDLTHNFISPSLEKLYGRSKQELLDNPNLFQDITHPDDQHLTEKAMKQLLEEGKAERECRIIKPDGSIVWVNDRSKMIYDENHLPIRVDGVTRDITERKRLELKNQALVNIIEQSQDFIGVAEEGQEAFFVNPAGQSMVGLDDDETVRNTKVLEYFLDEDLSFVKNTILPTLFSTGRWSGEFRFRHFKTGEAIPVLYDLFLTEDPETGELKNITTISRDISEQKKYKEELLRKNNELEKQHLKLENAKEKAEESEQRFRSLIENAPDGVVIIDESGKFKYVSPNAERLFGYNKGEAIGRSGDEYTHPEDLPMVLKTIETIFANPGLKPTVQYRFKRKSCEFRWIETTFTNLLSDKAINGIVLNFSDITERKYAVEELRKSKALLSETESIGKVGGWSFNIDTMAQKWTDEVFHIHEVEISDNPGVEAGINYYTRESRPIIEKALQRAIEHGENYDLELEIITAKGNTRAVHTIGKADLKNRRIYGFFQDITVRKKAEDALKAKMDELERFHKLTVGREITMVELKKEVNKLLNHLGKDDKYKIVE